MGNKTGVWVVFNKHGVAVMECMSSMEAMLAMTDRGDHTEFFPGMKPGTLVSTVGGKDTAN